MDDQAAAARNFPLDWRTLRALAVVFFAVKLALIALVQPFMDETYYWMWGQHPALSYFDHPPLIAWTQGLSGAIFGWNKFALRLPVVLTLLADIGIIYLFARRLSGETWRERFWLTTLIFLVTPVFFALTSVALPDHLMVLLLLAALYGFHGVLIAHDDGRRDLRLLYLGALALGLAVLAKYYAALFGLGLLVFLVALPRYRPLLKSPHVWLAMALVIALQAPVIAWNAAHDFASFRFIAGGRAGLGGAPSFVGTLGYLLGILVMLSPFLLVPLGRFLFRREGGPGNVARFAFWTSTLAFLLASVFTNILIHWNLVAYVAVLPFLAAELRSRLVLFGHLAFGTLVIAVIAANYWLMPVAALVNPAADQTSSWSYGWPEVAAHVEAAKVGRDIGFVAATSYELAGPLGYALKDRDVVSLASRTDAFDFWFDRRVRAGQSVLIVADGWRPLREALQQRFSSVELLDTVEIVVFGKRIDRYRIYFATGFSP